MASPLYIPHFLVLSLYSAKAMDWSKQAVERVNQRLVSLKGQVKDILEATDEACTLKTGAEQLAALEHLMVSFEFARITTRDIKNLGSEHGQAFRHRLDERKKNKLASKQASKQATKHALDQLNQRNHWVMERAVEVMNNHRQSPIEELAWYVSTIFQPMNAQQIAELSDCSYFCVTNTDKYKEAKPVFEVISEIFKQYTILGKLPEKGEGSGKKQQQMKEDDKERN